MENHKANREKDWLVLSLLFSGTDEEIDVFAKRVLSYSATPRLMIWKDIWKSVFHWTVQWISEPFAILFTNINFSSSILKLLLTYSYFFYSFVRCMPQFLHNLEMNVGFEVLQMKPNYLCLLCIIWTCSVETWIYLMDLACSKCPLGSPS